MIESWNTFLEFSYASEILMAVGGVAILLAVLKIIGSSIRLVLWVVLAATGVFLLNFGYERSDYSQSATLRERIESIETISIKDLPWKDIDFSQLRDAGVTGFQEQQTQPVGLASLQQLCAKLDGAAE